MDLDGTRKSINLLVLGLLCLLLGSYLFSSRKSVVLLPLALTVNGVAISAYGIVQRLNSGTRILGVIELSEGGTPFGPFVNQNNAAGYLLICLACSLGLTIVAFNRFVSGRRPRQIITSDYPVWHRARLHVGLFFAELDVARLLALTSGAIIVIGIMATLSRGGVLGLASGAVVTALFYSFSRQSFGFLLGCVLVAAVAVIMFSYLGLGEQMVRRLARTSEADFLTNEPRLNHWAETSPAIVDFAPLGSGAGSYDNVHRMYRGDFEERIFYHAENQYFQALVETGIGGLVLLLAAMVLLGLYIRFLAIRGNSPKTAAVCLMGVFLLSSQAVVSLFDFGTYIGGITVTLAMTCGMLAGQAHSLANRLKTKSAYRFNFPISLNMTMLLLVFAGGLFAGLDAWRYTGMELAMGTRPATENPDTTDLETVQRRIAALQAALSPLGDADAYRRLGELFVLRYRLTMYEQMLGGLTPEQQGSAAIRNRVWLSTGLDRMQTYIEAARKDDDRQLLKRWREDKPVVPNLNPNAVENLKKSRARNPLQPTVHLRLGQLQVLSETPDAEVPHLLRARELAPANAVTYFIAGLMDLQAERLDEACTSLRRCLELNPGRYELVVQVALPRLARERIIREVLPDDAFMLFNFAFNYLNAQSAQPLRIETYRKARRLLEEEYRDDRKSLMVLSDIQNGLGDVNAAIETLQLAIELNPEHQQLRIKLIQLLQQAGRYDQALEEIAWIRRHGEMRPALESLERKNP